MQARVLIAVRVCNGEIRPPSEFTSDILNVALGIVEMHPEADVARVQEYLYRAAEDPKAVGVSARVLQDWQRYLREACE